MLESCFIVYLQWTVMFEVRVPVTVRAGFDDRCEAEQLRCEGAEGVLHHFEHPGA